MKPIAEWHYVLDTYVPAILVAVIMIALFPVRILVCLLLPIDSSCEWHPLHKIKKFWEF